MKVRFPDILRPFLGKLVWRKNSSERVIYITFDDGPVPEVTLQILDLLDEHNIKATFFCVGENVEKYPEIYAELIKRNHKTGNHTFNHLRGNNFSTSEYVENTIKASEFIDSKLFRPPYGRITFQQKRKLKHKFQLIMWDLLTHDYDKRFSPEKILQNIKRYSRSGSIIVFHDSRKAKDNVLNVLPLAIEFWKNNGYGFGTL